MNLVIKKGRHYSSPWYKKLGFHFRKRKAVYIIKLDKNCLYTPKTTAWQKIAGFCPCIVFRKLFDKKGRPPQEWYSIRIAYRVAKKGIEVALYTKIKGEYRIAVFKQKLLPGSYEWFELGIHQDREIYLYWKGADEKRVINWGKIPKGIGFDLYPYFEDGKPNKEGAAPHDMNFIVDEISI